MSAFYYCPFKMLIAGFASLTTKPPKFAHSNLGYDYRTGMNKLEIKVRI
jgi:hypothetical protein